MAKIVDIEKELAGVTFLEGRTRHSDTKGTFARAGEYRGDSVISIGGFSGTSQWERHPNGEEIVQILKGSTKVSLKTAEGTETHELTEGMFIIVPQGVWHQFNTDGVTLMTVTPQPTDHIPDEDPPV